MSMDYIRRTYGVPAKRGARVRFDGHSSCLGTIISATSGGRVRVLFDGSRIAVSMHPTWALTYLQEPPP